MKLKWSLFIVTLVFLNLSVYGLEIDEKLTLRIVNTSESKKTLLINRGIEDGLAKGDHAKFYVSSGVVARGVCIKLSPTRSVWSIYRMVNAPFLVDDQVMNLKITPAVKITKDESRMLVSDDTRVGTKDPRDLGIPLADGADDLRTNEVLDTPIKSEKLLEDAPIESLLQRNKEVFGMIHFSNQTETASPDDNTDDFSADLANIYLKFGGEWYFNEESNWYHRISFQGVFIMDRRATMSHLGSLVKDESNEFGIGVNLNLFDYPSQTYRFLHYLNYTFSLGSSTTTYESGAESATSEVDTVNGAVLSNAFGYGVKYFTPSGFGMRFEMSYILRGDTYGTSSKSDISYIKTRIGPTFQVGVGYRF